MAAGGLAVAGLVTAFSTAGSTYAAWSDYAVISGNRLSAWIEVDVSDCNPQVEEPSKDTPGVDTASCQLTVKNDGPSDLTLDVKVATHSVSNSGDPVMYFDGSPTDVPPNKDPKHAVPDYSENLFITDGAGNSYPFGDLDCPPVDTNVKPKPKPAPTATCSSDATTPDAVTLHPGGTETFTVTVHLNHGGHNGATLHVDLDAMAGSGTIGSLSSTFGLS